MSKKLKHISGSVSAIEDYFREQKKPFEILSTNYTTIIRNESKQYIIADEFTGVGFLRLLTSFRNQVKKNVENIDLKMKEIKYYNFNSDYFHESNGVIEGTEIDISKAYLYAALYCKFIDEKMFNILLKLKKSTRLKVLGSLATRKKIFYYEAGGKLIKQEIKKDDKFLICWNNICYQVDDYINNVISLNNFNLFVFYWFDNLFFAIKDISNFNPIDKKYILKYNRNVLFYNWSHHNLLNIQIDNRLFNIARKY